MHRCWLAVLPVCQLYPGEKASVCFAGTAHHSLLAWLLLLLLVPQKVLNTPQKVEYMKVRQPAWHPLECAAQSTYHA
jgi:hypothetical protein